MCFGPRKRLNYVESMVESFFIMFVTNIMKTYVLRAVDMCPISVRVCVFVLYASRDTITVVNQLRVFGQHRIARIPRNSCRVIW